MERKNVIIAVGAAGAAAIALLLWTRRAAAAAKTQTRMVVTTPPPSSVAAGEGFTFAGYLEDTAGNRLAGKPINLYTDSTLAGSVTTDAEGGWSFTVSLNESATLYAEFPGDEGYLGCLRT